MGDNSKNGSETNATGNDMGDSHQAGSRETGNDTASNVTTLPSAEDRGAKLRILEALLFATPDPLSIKALSEHLDETDNVNALIEELQSLYASRGVNLIEVAGKWAFRTAPDLGYLLERHAVEQRKLSKAALETLAIIAYHQPVTRSEIEEIRGVAISKGTLDVLIETEWVRLRGRRRAPGRPITYGTTDLFLDYFGIGTLRDLPGVKELKNAGLLSGNLPPDFEAPDPRDVAELMADEDPLEDEADLFDELEEQADEDIAIELEDEDPDHQSNDAQDKHLSGHQNGDKADEA